MGRSILVLAPPSNKPCSLPNMVCTALAVAETLEVALRAAEGEEVLLAVDSEKVEEEKEEEEEEEVEKASPSRRGSSKREKTMGRGSSEEETAARFLLGGELVPMPWCNCAGVVFVGGGGSCLFC